MAKTRDPKNETCRKNLRKFRDDLGITAEQAAMLAEVPIDSLRRYEQGKSGVPGRVLRKLAKLYGHTMDDFYEEKPPKPNLEGREPFLLLQMPGQRIDPAKWEAFLREVAKAASRTMR